MPHSARTMRRAADHIAAVDPAFIPIISESPLCTIGRKDRPDPFHSLVMSVIGQQLSVKAADTITARLHAHLDGSITAAALVGASVDDLRSVGLSGAKVRTITELAHAVHGGDLDLDAAAAHEDDHTIMSELTRFWGIGRWTAEMFLMFTLHRLDVWPVGDLAMRKGWQQIHRARAKDIDPARLDRLGKKFAPYRSVAAWYCWRIIDGDSATW
jgi:DNA-3-methyladenine glycosylase II